MNIVRLFCLSGVLIFLSACGGGGSSGLSETTSGTIPATLSISGFKQSAPSNSVQSNLNLPARENVNSTPRMAKSLVTGSSTAPSFTPAATPSTGYIIAGAPDYLKLTLTRLYVTINGVNNIIWSGSKTLTVTDGAVDISDISSSFNKINPGTATQLTAEFNSSAKIKGSLTGSFYSSAGMSGLVSGTTVSTKADAAYDAVNHTGGASSYTHFTSSTSEETDVSLSSDSTFSVSVPCNVAITASSTPVLSIVIDLNRSLRFYSGGNITHNGGVGPSDPANKAYFFGSITQT